MIKKLTPEQSQLAADNHNLIYWFMQKHNLDEEWYDVLAIGLVNAAATYKGTAAFSTYAICCMKNEWLRELKLVNRRIDTLSLDFEYFHSDGDGYSIADSYVGEEDFTAKYEEENSVFNLVSFFESKCTSKAQLDALHMMIKGVPMHDAAKKIGISHQRMYQIRDKFKREYLKLFNEEGNIRPAKVGDAVCITDKPYKFSVMARDDRYIICTHNRTPDTPFENIIIDLERKIYGSAKDASTYSFSGVAKCKKRLKELYTGETVINENVKNIDFLVA